MIVGGLRTFPILIKSDGRINDTDCRRTLLRGGDNQVQWIASGPGNWRIEFTNGSPFVDNFFEVSVGSPRESGPPRANAELRPYKYRVLNPDRAITDDPDVLIEG
jgi:hypothetical protein